jgi:hypothetical protein
LPLRIAAKPSVVSVDTKRDRYRRQGVPKLGHLFFSPKATDEPFGPPA